MDRARSTPLYQLPSPSPATASGVVEGEDKEERNTAERPNAASDEPRGQRGGGGDRNQVVCEVATVGELAEMVVSVEAINVYNLRQLLLGLTPLATIATCQFQS